MAQGKIFALLRYSVTARQSEDPKSNEERPSSIDDHTLERIKQWRENLSG